MNELEKGKVVDFTTDGSTQKPGLAEVNDEDLFFFDDGKPDDDAVEGRNDNTGNESSETVSLQVDMNMPENGSFQQTSLFNVSQPSDDVNSLLDEKAEIETRIDGLPVFEYAGARKTIRDLQISFEQLRVEKAKDFPELENASRVSWTMEYGITKSITNPNDTISKIKTDIESSADFLKEVKKSKKKIECKVKPRVTGQTKGAASYKGYYFTLAEAEQHNKAISILPSRDGRVYEMRKNEIGTFITPVAEIDGLDYIKTGFRLSLPKIPWAIFSEVLAFFKRYSFVGNGYDVMAQILWDRQEGSYVTHIPAQQVGKSSIVTTDSLVDEERYVVVMDIRSHNTMEAGFSGIDDEDECAIRIYAVVGRLDRFFPEVSVRVSNGRKFLEVDPNQIFQNPLSTYPVWWNGRVILDEPDNGEVEGLCCPFVIPPRMVLKPTKVRRDYSRRR